MKYANIIMCCGLAVALLAAPGRAALAGDDEPSEREPYDPGAASRTVEFWRARTERDPRGFLEWRELAAAYLARQRETGDVADAVKAEKAARKSLEIMPRRNSAARLRLARGLLSQHRFPEALEAAEEGAKSDVQANRLVADIRIELGDVEGAETALAATPPGDDDLNHLALRARIDEARGKHASAMARLREACEIVDARPDIPAETAGWTHTMLGHALIDSGRIDDGEKSCLRALELFPADYRAMTGLAEAAAFRQDWKRAETWARKAVAVSEQNPEALRLLAESLEKQGDADAATQQERRLESLCRSFPRIYDRHWALFCADKKRDLDQALRVAQDDLALRKDPGAYDTLAWVTFQKGQVSEARRLIDRAIATGVQSASFYYHAGVIATADGDADRATSLLERSRALNAELYRAMQSE